MKHIQDIMPNITPPMQDGQGNSRDQEGQKCLVCGEYIRFYENEYKKPCQNCGTWVFEGRKARKIVKKEIKCLTCLDVGLVEYPVQREMGVCKYYARCNCPKGIDWPAAMPILSDCELAPEAKFIQLRNAGKIKKVWEG